MNKNKTQQQDNNENLPATLANESYGTLTGSNVKSVDEMLDALDSVDEIHFEDQTSEYLELKPNDKVSLLFTGMTTFRNDKGQDVPAVHFTGKENKKYIYAGAVVVGSLAKVTQMPCLVRLTHGGMVKGKNGTYADIRVQVLKPAN